MSVPEVIKGIKKDLITSHAMGLPISHTMACAVIQAHLKVYTPSIVDNPQFKCLDTFVWLFLYNEL